MPAFLAGRGLEPEELGFVLGAATALRFNVRVRCFQTEELNQGPYGAVEPVNDEIPDRALADAEPGADLSLGDALLLQFEDGVNVRRKTERPKLFLVNGLCLMSRGSGLTGSGLVSRLLIERA